MFPGRTRVRRPAQYEHLTGAPESEDNCDGDGDDDYYYCYCCCCCCCYYSCYYSCYCYCCCCCYYYYYYCYYYYYYVLLLPLLLLLLLLLRRTATTTTTTTTTPTTTTTTVAGGLSQGVIRVCGFPESPTVEVSHPFSALPPPQLTSRGPTEFEGPPYRKLAATLCCTALKMTLLDAVE